MTFKQALCLVLISVICRAVAENPADAIVVDQCTDPDFKRNTHELITSKGYPAENYTITTKDNYILILHRIPNGNGYKGDNTPRRVLYLQHGLFADSSTFVLNYANNSLAFLAYDQGYDVFLGNVRGNTYGRNHTTLNPNIEPQFWNFSFDEMIKHDLPDMIDFALNKTSQSRLYYAGHSMGTTLPLGLLSKNETYKSKIVALGLMAPIASVHNIANTGLPLFGAALLTGPLLAVAGIATGGAPGELLPNSIAIKKYAQKVCGSQSYDALCQKLTALLIASGPYVDKDRTCVYLGHFPAGSSANTLQHYTQEMLQTSPVFRMYDHYALNQVKYSQLTPPNYDVSRIETPVGLFSSTGDIISVQKDIDFLRQTMKNSTIAVDYIVQDKDFVHNAFAWASNAPDKVYNRLLEFLKTY